MENRICSVGSYVMEEAWTAAFRAGDLNFLKYLLKEQSESLSMRTMRYYGDHLCLERILYRLLSHSSIVGNSSLEFVKCMCVSLCATDRYGRDLNDLLICHAASQGNIETLTYLLSLGYKEGTLNKALAEACEGESVESVKLLLNAGGDPRTRQGECMKLACRKGTNYLHNVPHRISDSFVEPSRSFGCCADPS